MGNCCSGCKKPREEEDVEMIIGMPVVGSSTSKTPVVKVTIENEIEGKIVPCDKSNVEEIVVKSSALFSPKLVEEEAAIKLADSSFALKDVHAVSRCVATLVGRVDDEIMKKKCEKTAQDFVKLLLFESINVVKAENALRIANAPGLIGLLDVTNTTADEVLSDSASILGSTGKTNTVEAIKPVAVADIAVAQSVLDKAIAADQDKEKRFAAVANNLVTLVIKGSKVIVAAENILATGQALNIATGQELGIVSHPKLASLSDTAIALTDKTLLDSVNELSLVDSMDIAPLLNPTDVKIMDAGKAQKEIMKKKYKKTAQDFVKMLLLKSADVVKAENALKFVNAPAFIGPLDATNALADVVSSNSASRLSSTSTTNTVIAFDVVAVANIATAPRVLKMPIPADLENEKRFSAIARGLVTLVINESKAIVAAKDILAIGQALGIVSHPSLTSLSDTAIALTDKTLLDSVNELGMVCPTDIAPLSDPMDVNILDDGKAQKEIMKKKCKKTAQDFGKLLLFKSIDVVVKAEKALRIANVTGLIDPLDATNASAEVVSSDSSRILGSTSTVAAFDNVAVADIATAPRVLDMAISVDLENKKRFSAIAQGLVTLVINESKVVVAAEDILALGQALGIASYPKMASLSEIAIALADKTLLDATNALADVLSSNFASISGSATTTNTVTGFEPVAVADSAATPRVLDMAIPADLDKEKRFAEVANDLVTLIINESKVVVAAKDILATGQALGIATGQALGIATGQALGIVSQPRLTSLSDTAIALVHQTLLDSVNKLGLVCPTDIAPLLDPTGVNKIDAEKAHKKITKKKYKKTAQDFVKILLIESIDVVEAKNALKIANAQAFIRPLDATNESAEVVSSDSAKILGSTSTVAAFDPVAVADIATAPRVLDMAIPVDLENKKRFSAIAHNLVTLVINESKVVVAAEDILALGQALGIASYPKMASLSDIAIALADKTLLDATNALADVLSLDFASISGSASTTNTVTGFEPVAVADSAAAPKVLDMAIPADLDNEERFAAVANDLVTLVIKESKVIVAAENILATGQALGIASHPSLASLSDTAIALTDKTLLDSVNEMVLVDLTANAQGLKKVQLKLLKDALSNQSPNQLPAKQSPSLPSSSDTAIALADEVLFDSVNELGLDESTDVAFGSDNLLDLVQSF